jgi:hypothetical protein
LWDFVRSGAGDKKAELLAAGACVHLFDTGARRALTERRQAETIPGICVSFVGRDVD